MVPSTYDFVYERAFLCRLCPRCGRPVSKMAVHPILSGALVGVLLPEIHREGAAVWYHRACFVRSSGVAFPSGGAVARRGQPAGVCRP